MKFGHELKNHLDKYVIAAWRCWLQWPVCLNACHVPVSHTLCSNSARFVSSRSCTPSSRARNCVPPLLVSRCEACRPQDYVDYSGLKKAIKNVRCHPHRAQRSPSSMLITRAAAWPFILSHMAFQNLPMSAYFRRNPNPPLLEQKGACGLSLSPALQRACTHRASMGKMSHGRGQAGAQCVPSDV